MAFVAIESDRSGELVERGCDAEPFVEWVAAELVVAATKVLHERMAPDDTLAVRSPGGPRIGRNLLSGAHGRTRPDCSRGRS